MIAHESRERECKATLATNCDCCPIHSHRQNLNMFKVDECARECKRVCGDSHALSSPCDRSFTSLLRLPCNELCYFLYRVNLKFHFSPTECQVRAEMRQELLPSRGRIQEGPLYHKMRRQSLLTTGTSQVLFCRGIWMDEASQLPVRPAVALP